MAPVYTVYEVSGIAVIRVPVGASLLYTGRRRTLYIGVPFNAVYLDAPLPYI